MVYVNAAYSLTIRDRNGAMIASRASVAPNTPAGTVRTRDTVAIMKADLTLAAGDIVQTAGYAAAGDGGGASYQIVTAAAYGAVPDGYGNHYMTGNLLVAKLLIGGVYVGEKWGAVQGVECSAQLQAAWNALVAWQTAIGNNASVSFTHSSTCTLLNQVLMAGASASRIKNIHVNMTTSKLTAVVGGNLSSTNFMIHARLQGGEHYWGELDGGKFAAGLDLNGPGSGRDFHPVIRHHKGKGIRVRGACGSYILYAPIITEYVQEDAEFNTQANFTSVGLSVEDGDFNVFSANILFNKTCVLIDAVAVQVYFFGAHLVNGNPNFGGAILPFADMELIQNNATRANYMVDCYFDNGPVNDYQNTLNIRGGNYVKNGAATITEPKIRQYPQAVGQINMPEICVLDVGGEASVGFVNTGVFTWGGDITVTDDQTTGMAAHNSAVNVVKTQYYLYPPSAEEVAVHLKTQGDFRTVYKSGTSQTSMLVSPLGNYFQIAADIVPALDSTRDLGSTTVRWKRLWTTVINLFTGTVIITAGAGTPEGVITAGIGSLFLRSDGGAGTSLYVKQSGTGNTGWVGK